MSSEPTRRSRLDNFLLAFTQTRAQDPRLVPLMAGVAVAVLVLFVVIGFLLDAPVLWALIALPLALLGALFVFGQRASAAALGAIEGRPGAAAAVLQSIRRGWHVTPAVAFTRKQDYVHRAVGRPGVVLVGEGSPARVASLLKQERRRVAPVVGDAPIHEISVGDGSGQVPLRQLQVHLTRLPRTLKPDAARTLDARLSTLDKNIPLPKGPLPKAPRRRM